MGKSPPNWKTAVLCRICKVEGQGNDSATTEELTYLPVLSKLFTRIVAARLGEWLSDNREGGGGGYSLDLEIKTQNEG
jgi:hypothetical protein